MHADDLIGKANSCLKSNNTLSALSCFEKARMVKETPEVLSCLGYCIVVERGQLAEGISLCLKALSLEPGNTVHYLNLGRIYLRTGDKEKAIALFRQGLAHGNNDEIRDMLIRFGTRRHPPFPFLDRSHFLNKYTGLILSRIKLRR